MVFFYVITFYHSLDRSWFVDFKDTEARAATLSRVTITDYTFSLRVTFRNGSRLDGLGSKKFR